MLEIAREGGYLDGVAIMLAAEWMYATWCSRAAKRAIRDRLSRRWVELHAEPEFLAQADWLRGQLNAADPSEEASLGQRFRRALELEIAFHDAPFEGVG
jgi:thiaminase/transcriptional activator TenA